MDDDEWAIVYGLDPVRDRSDIYKRDDEGALIQAHREVPPNPQLLMKAAASLLSATYGETVTHQVQIGGVLRIGSTPAPQLPPPVDVDFINVDDMQALEQTNVLAVAEPPKSVADFEETFGGRQLVECVYFYDEDGRLLPPLDGIVIIAGSSADRLYNEAGIAHATTPASDLLAQGYCNELLLRMAKPAESALVSDLRAKLKAGVRHPLPTHAVQKFKPGDEPATEPQPPESDVRNPSPRLFDPRLEHPQAGGSNGEPDRRRRASWLRPRATGRQIGHSLSTVNLNAKGLSRPNKLSKLSLSSSKLRANKHLVGYRHGRSTICLRRMVNLQITLADSLSFKTNGVTPLPALKDGRGSPARRAARMVPVGTRRTSDLWGSLHAATRRQRA